MSTTFTPPRPDQWEGPAKDAGFTPPPVSAWEGPATKQVRSSPKRPEDIQHISISPALETVASGVGDVMNPVPAIRQFGRRVSDAGVIPALRATAKDAWDAQVDQGRQAVELAKKGRYSEAAGRGAAAILPLAGPIAARAGETFGGKPEMPPDQRVGTDAQDSSEVRQPDIARGIGQSLALVGPSVLPAIARGAGRVASKTGDVAGRTASEVLGATTGAGGEAVRTAFQRPTPELQSAMRGGMSEVDIVNDFKGALKKARDQRGDQYRQQLAGISNTQAPPLSIAPVRQAVLDALDRHNVKVTPQGLDFSRSTISSKAEQARIQEAIGDITSWGSKPEDLTPLGVDTLKRRVRDFYAPESKQANALIRSLDKPITEILNKQVPGYQEMTRDYKVASDLIDKIESELSLGQNAKEGTSIRKITYALKQNNEYRKMLTEALQDFSDKDLKGELAGYHLKNSAPRGITAPFMAAEALREAAHGNFAALPAMLATSPRLVGETVMAAGRAGRAAAGPVKAIGRALNKPGVYRMDELVAGARAPQANTPTANVGDKMMHEGKPVRITKIYPDGMVDIEPIE